MYWLDDQSTGGRRERFISPSTRVEDRFITQVIRGEAEYRNDGFYYVPEGHGDHSGRRVSTPHFTYHKLVNSRMLDTPATPDECYKPYNFADDEDFASKMKYYYSQTPRRTGRTHLMARILVEMAIETGRRIHIINDHERIHNDRRDGYHQLHRAVQEVLREYQMKGCNLDVRFGGRNDGVEGTWIEVRMNDYHAYNQIRIKDYNPRRHDYVMGFDPYKVEEKEDDELLITCNIKSL